MAERVAVKKLRGIYRLVVEGSNKLARNKDGEPRDHGGHYDEAYAKRQMNAVNAGLAAAAKRRKKKAA